MEMCSHVDSISNSGASSPTSTLCVWRWRSSTSTDDNFDTRSTTSSMSRIIEAMTSLWKGPDAARLRDQLAGPCATAQNAAAVTAPSAPSAGLNTWEVKQLTKTWHAMTEQTEVGLQCMRSVFDKHPDARAVFGLRNANMRTMLRDDRVRRQAAIIQDTIEMVIIDLASDTGRLRWPLVTLGEQHSRMVNRGFRKEYLVTFGVALMNTIDQMPLNSLNRWKRWKTIRLWRRFVHFLMTCLITGFNLGMVDRPQALQNNHQRAKCSALQMVERRTSNENTVKIKLEKDEKSRDSMRSTIGILGHLAASNVAGIITPHKLPGSLSMCSITEENRQPVDDRQRSPPKQRVGSLLSVPGAQLMSCATTASDTSPTLVKYEINGVTSSADANCNVPT